MSDGVLNLFLQTVDHDMENLDGELQKLIAYKGEKAEIRAEDIRAVCTWRKSIPKGRFRFIAHCFP